MTVLLADLVNMAMYYLKIVDRKILLDSTVNSALAREFHLSNLTDVNFLTLLPQNPSLLKHFEKIKSDNPNVNFLSDNFPQIPGTGLLLSNTINTDGEKTRERNNDDLDIDDKFYNDFISPQIQSLDLNTAVVSGYLKENFKENLINQLLKIKQESNPELKLFYFGNQEERLKDLASYGDGTFLENLSFGIIKDEDFLSLNPEIVSNLDILVDDLCDGMLFSFKRESDELWNCYMYNQKKNQLSVHQIKSTKDRSYLELPLMDYLLSKVSAMSSQKLSCKLNMLSDIFSKFGSIKEPMSNLKELQQLSTVYDESAKSLGIIFPSELFKLNVANVRTHVQSSGNGYVRGSYVLYQSKNKSELYVGFMNNLVCDGLGAYYALRAKMILGQLFKENDFNHSSVDYISKQFKDQFVQELRLLTETAKGVDKKMFEDLKRQMHLTIFHLQKNLRSVHNYSLNFVNFGSNKLDGFFSLDDTFVKRPYISNFSAPILDDNAKFEKSTHKIDTESTGLYFLLSNYAFSQTSGLLDDPNQNQLETVLQNGLPKPHALKQDGAFVLIKLNK